MELGGYGAGPPDPDGLAEALVEELSVPQPGLGHSLFVLQGAELTGEHWVGTITGFGLGLDYIPSQVSDTESNIKLDWGSIRSSPRDGFNFF